jgi:hypothetical protein
LVAIWRWGRIRGTQQRWRRGGRRKARWKADGRGSPRLLRIEEAATNGGSVCDRQRRRWRRRGRDALADVRLRRDGGGEVAVRCGCGGGGEVATRSMRSPTEEGGRPRSDAQNRSRRVWGARGGRARAEGKFTAAPSKVRPSFFVSTLFFLGVEKKNNLSYF